MSRESRVTLAHCTRSVLLILYLIGGSADLRAEEINTPSPTPLWARGYAVLPEPQKVELGEQDFHLDASWIITVSEGVAKEDIAVHVLTEKLRKEFHLNLSPDSSGRTGKQQVLELAIRPGTAAAGVKPELYRQAYLLEAAPSRIRVTGNSGAGLLYGVSTLLQLLRSKPGKQCSLPEVRIEDWPELELQ